MLKALLWKDVRVSRLPLLAGFVLLVGPYFLAAATAAGSPPSASTASSTATVWSGALVLGSLYSVGFSQLTLAILAANAIAVERVDRSANFLAYLPASRSQILLSKSLVLLGAAVVILATNCGAWLLGMSLLTEPAPGTEPMSIGHLFKTSLVGLGSAGVGWAVSARAETTGPPLVLAISTPIVIYGLFFGTYLLCDWPISGLSGNVVLATCGVVGVVFYVIGCLYFLRRIEP